MRRKLPLLYALMTVCTLLPAASAFAQQGGGDDDDKKAKRKAEWELRQAPLPGKRNAGPCPFVKTLYDAARYAEFKDGQEASSAVAYTGEINNVAAECEYKGAEPIKLKMQVDFGFGRGPQGTDEKKSYRYWVAVTQRNQAVLAKEYFTVPVDFSGGDRVAMGDRIESIVIPRASETVSGDNFEVLVGFDVTPQMAEFNREGKRFRVNAGAPVASAANTGK